jgi:hypothetical protein
MYQTLADSIRPLVERKDGKGKDTSDIQIGGRETVQNYRHSLPRVACSAR